MIDFGETSAFFGRNFSHFDHHFCLRYNLMMSKNVWNLPPRTYGADNLSHLRESKHAETHLSA
jgi:hypothetical protein